MEKVEKLFDSYKGLIVFYIIVAVLAFLIAQKIEDINSQAQNVTVEKTYYA